VKQLRQLKALVMAVFAAAVLSGCTGGGSSSRPSGEQPNSSRLPTETASQMAATLEAATQELGQCGMTFGTPLYAATTDLQCSFDGRFVRLLAYRPPAAPPMAVPGLRDRTVLFGATWLVIASDVAQARAIRAVLGGRLYLTPVLVATDRVALLGRARVSRPTGSTVRFRIGVHNPMDGSAVLACHARGLSADGTILFREQPTTTDGLRLRFEARSRGKLSGTAHLLRPGGVARIISWCVAHPVTQPE
jgi:hypothetical protein